MDWARHLIPSLRAAGVTISTDLHDWDGENPYHRDFALGADVVFVSGVQLADGAAEWILERGVAERVVVTHGAGGADLVTRDGRTHREAADPGAPIVDTNGAGDAFAAAFLVAWTAGKSDGECLADGTVAGAYACTRTVGAGAFVTGAELDRRSFVAGPELDRRSLVTRGRAGPDRRSE